MKRTNSNNSYSVILPTFNESGNIIQLIDEILKVTPVGYRCEVIVVDDNSPDDTFKLVKNKFNNKNNVRAILRTSQRGLGKSILHGIKEAKYEKVIIMDSDLTHDPVEIPRLLHVGKIYDIVSGSRFCAGGKMTDTKHYIASLVYNWFLRVIIRTQVQDNLGGYFVANRSQILDLPVNKIFTGYGEYYFSFLHFSIAAGLSIVEIPSHYLLRGKGKSKSNWFKMIISYTSAALKLKWSVGAYKIKVGSKISNNLNIK